eukprot:CAMPEP_0194296908 /NCGR_PEP_ID=MMETSP0169-20130528/57461_1 /TAXON_ID=218684 /ORGANISM="Corethron pennatum, Strain L29A3" /LENGTH=67 /DNA_ID=CAMNT_0039046549 /DNA_START=230 /DNA_END=433 /DNA_ORIENTATION=+
MPSFAMIARATSVYVTAIADVCLEVVITRKKLDNTSETKEQQKPIAALRPSLAKPVYVSGTKSFNVL